MSRVDQAITGERENLLLDAAPHHVHVTTLKIGSPGGANHQAVASEGHGLVLCDERGAADRVARCCASSYGAVAKAQYRTVFDGNVDFVNIKAFGQGDLGVKLLFEPPRGGHMVCMDVSVECVPQLQAQFAQQGNVASELLIHRINDDRLA